MAWRICDCGQACPEDQHVCGHCGRALEGEPVDASVEQLRNVWTVFFHELWKRARPRKDR